MVDPGRLAIGSLLARRTETKFVVPRAALDLLLEALVPHAGVVESSGRRLARYSTVYFDTPGLRCFHDHRRGVRPRCKIRLRHYLDRSLTFLEIKTRRGLVTDKLRFEREPGHTELDAADRALLADRTGLDDLGPRAWTLYARATLVGLGAIERVTIDTDIELRTTAGATRLQDVVRRLGHRPLSISKYCAAIATTREIREGRLTYGLRRLAAIGRW